MRSPNPTLKRVLVVGCGRAGASLALTLARRGFAVAVRDRDAAKARALARRLHLSTTRSRRWDLVVLAVPDPRIAEVARTLAREGLAPGFAIHLGGATPVEALSPLARAGWRIAKAHPVFVFPPEPATLPRGVYFGVGAGSSGGLREVRALVRRLGGRPIVIRDGMDAAWHLACVMAGNGLFAQLHAAGTVLDSAAERSTDRAVNALAPLVRSALENALHAGLAGGLTGPVARGDAGTIERHIATLLDRYPDFSVLYAASSALLLGLLPPSGRAVLRRRLKRVGLLI